MSFEAEILNTLKKWKIEISFEDLSKFVKARTTEELKTLKDDLDRLKLEGKIKEETPYWYALLRDTKKDVTPTLDFSFKSDLDKEIRASDVDFIAMMEEFIQKLPIYFDNAQIWYVFDGKKWVQKDEVDILNAIHRATTWNNITNTSIKTQLITALKMVSRRNAPSIPAREEILTASGVYNILTKEVSEPSARYFFTNYVPHFIGTGECPTIEKLVQSWVSSDKVQQVYEIMAYMLYRGYPIQRIFCLLGSGSNGKGSFVRLVSKILGEENITSFSMRRLTIDKFQTAKLYNKLVGVSTEIDYALFEETSLIKALTGGDPIPIEFKNKMPFDFYNYSKIVISTNSLPATTDRTPGFYRRWLILDFPNRFDDGKDVIDDIPEAEYEALLGKLLGILPGLIERGKFTNEGNLEEKQRHYETKSNPIELFINQFCTKDINEFIPMYKFREKFVAFAVQNGYRRLSDREIWGLLDLMGLENTRQRIHFDDGEERQVRCIMGLDWKVTKQEEIKEVTLNEFCDGSDTCDVPSTRANNKSYNNTVPSMIDVTNVTSVTNNGNPPLTAPVPVATVSARQIRNGIRNIVSEFKQAHGGELATFEAILKCYEPENIPLIDKVIGEMLTAGELLEPRPGFLDVI